MPHLSVTGGTFVLRPFCCPIIMYDTPSIEPMPATIAGSSRPATGSVHCWCMLLCLRLECAAEPVLRPHAEQQHETTPARSPCSSTNLSVMLSAISRNVGRLGWRATCSCCTGVSRLYVSVRSCRSRYPHSECHFQSLQGDLQGAAHEGSIACSYVSFRCMRMCLGGRGECWGSSSIWANTSRRSDQLAPEPPGPPAP